MRTCLTAAHAAALDALCHGWSVIPLLGGDERDRGKTPAIPWKAYQQQRATAHDLHTWFADRERSAFGVVCGCVSRLVVIDLDDPEVLSEFARCFPELMDTHTVRSGFRGTLHLYYEVDFPVPSQKLRGGDLKGEGGYVVGAGSEIAGQRWQLLNGRPPRRLSLDELSTILTAFGCVNSDVPLSQPIGRPASVDVVAEQYRAAARIGQRNNTLFRLALHLRDRGLPQLWTVEALAAVHAAQAVTDERADRRYREAQRTIASAYRLPRGRPQQRVSRLPTDDQVDNGLREALLKLPGGTAFLRMYEGLLLSGLRPGATFTHAHARQRLAQHVGDHSIRLALRMVLNDTPNDKAKRCFVPQQEPTKNRRGRPLTYYIMPSPAELRRRLGLKPTVSDPITADDLVSVQSYRAALEREFIRRRPGQYPQAWLAERLGVSVRTVYEYHRREGIVATPCFRSTRVTWENCEQLLPAPDVARRVGMRIEGRFLEDDTGKRYPALVGVARRLLEKGRSCMLRERTFSHYHVGELGSWKLNLRISPGISCDHGRKKNESPSSGRVSHQLRTLP